MQFNGKERNAKRSNSYVLRFFLLKVIQTFTIAILFWFALSAPIDSAWSRDVWKENAHLCNAPDGFLFPSKGAVADAPNKAFPNDCDDGDSSLFNGLLCFSGDELGCETVRRSLATPNPADPVKKRLYRSPRRAQNNNYHLEGIDPYSGDDGEVKTASPDQNVGVLLYAVAKRNTQEAHDALEGWFKWISDHRPCYKKKGGDGPGLLTGIGAAVAGFWGAIVGNNLETNCIRGLPRYCDHDECIMRPIDRDIDTAVFSAVRGIPPPDGISNYYTLANLIPQLIPIPPIPIALVVYNQLSVGKKLLINTDVDPPGYQTHLNAIRAWLLIRIQHPDSNDAREAIQRIATKQPKNPLYQYLHEGATPRVTTLVKQYCPAPNQSRGGGLQHWTWESTSLDSEVWKDGPAKIDNGRPSSMLWDCIFMRNLLGEKGRMLGHDHAGTNAAVSTLLVHPSAP